MNSPVRDPLLLKCVIWDKNLEPRRFRLVSLPCCIRWDEDFTHVFEHDGDLVPFQEFAVHVIDRSDNLLKIMLGMTNYRMMTNNFLTPLLEDPEIKPGGKNGFEVDIGFKDGKWIFSNPLRIPFSEEELADLKTNGLWDLEAITKTLCQVLDDSKKVCHEQNH